MPHDAPLIATIVAGFVLAFLFGAVANRLRVSPLVGYLLAGVVIGPYTPGFNADQELTLQLAEIGVILLMFGVGLHFSVKDLLSVKAIAIPGAVAQIAIATAMGMALAWWLGWSLGGGLVFGLALSVASTVVLLRALEERHLIETARGRIAVGWLVVEDLAMVLTLVLLPALAGFLGEAAGPSGDVRAPSALAIATTVALTIGKVAAFVAIMLVAGRRVIPWVLHHIAHTGSRELFRLAVLAIALGVAFGAAQLFDVSLALGAFFAGMVLSESELSHQAAHESLPLRDAFAVLFFVSVGMAFDPMIAVRETWPLVAVVLIIVLGKSLAAFAIVRAFGHSTGTALMISASLAQIGEFSFILASLGVGLGLLPEAGRGLILGGAILSIFLNPLIFGALDRLLPRLEPRAAAPDGAATAAALELRPSPAVALADHAVVVGYGRVGSLVGEALAAAGRPFVVIETRDSLVASLRDAGTPAIFGNAAASEVVAAANLPRARWLVVAIPNAFEAGQIVEQARAANPQLDIVARAHFDAEVEHLRSLGASTIVMGEREIARAMIAHVLRAEGA